MLRLTGIFRPLLVFVVAFGMFLSAFTAVNASTIVREIEGNYITTTSTSTGSVTTVVIDGQTTKVIEDVAADKITIIVPDGTATSTSRNEIQAAVAGI